MTSEERREARMRRAELAHNNPNLSRIVERNIRRIAQLRKLAEDSRSPQERISDAITSFAGSMAFIYFHVAFFSLWILVNLGAGKRAFDPFPSTLLTMVVSLEAIFLAAFVLVSQNRMQATTDERDDLDLQVDLLAEYEITRMLGLVRKIAEKMGIEDAADPELEELAMPIKPQNIIREMTSAGEHQVHPRPTGDSDV